MKLSLFFLLVMAGCATAPVLTRTQVPGSVPVEYYWISVWHGDTMDGYGDTISGCKAIKEPCPAEPRNGWRFECPGENIDLCNPHTHLLASGPAQ